MIKCGLAQFLQPKGHKTTMRSSSLICSNEAEYATILSFSVCAILFVMAADNFEFKRVYIGLLSFVIPIIVIIHISSALQEATTWTEQNVT